MANWFLRFHPKVHSLPFKSGTKRVDKTNARIHYIEGTITADLGLFEKEPELLSPKEKEEWMKTLQGVSCSSDAFFPFRDSIDVMKNYGVKYVAEPGNVTQ